VDRAGATALLARLHEAQNEFYGGGDGRALRDLLADNITWTVPGRNAIAGTYRGLDAVLGYFTRRRALADATFRMHRRDVLAGEGERVAALTDGTGDDRGPAADLVHRGPLRDPRRPYRRLLAAAARRRRVRRDLVRLTPVAAAAQPAAPECRHPGGPSSPARPAGSADRVMIRYSGRLSVTMTDRRPS